MKNKAILAFLGFAAMFALPAMAQKSDSGLYLGVGASSIYSSEFCHGAGPTCNDHDQALKGFVGYQFNRYLAVEGGYQGMGENRDDVTTATVKGQAGELVGILSFPFLKEFSVFVKGGAYYGRLRGFNPVTAASYSVVTTNYTAGGGLQWNFYDSFSLRGEYQRYPKMGGGNAGFTTDYDVYSISAIFMF